MPQDEGFDLSTEEGRMWYRVWIEYQREKGE